MLALVQQYAVRYGYGVVGYSLSLEGNDRVRCSVTTVDPHRGETTTTSDVWGIEFFKSIAAGEHPERIRNLFEREWYG